MNYFINHLVLSYCICSSMGILVQIGCCKKKKKKRTLKIKFYFMDLNYNGFSFLSAEKHYSLFMQEIITSALVIATAMQVTMRL